MLNERSIYFVHRLATAFYLSSSIFDSNYVRVGRYRLAVLWDRIYESVPEWQRMDNQQQRKLKHKRNGAKVEFKLAIGNAEMIDISSMQPLSNRVFYRSGVSQLQWQR